MIASILVDGVWPYKASPKLKAGVKRIHAFKFPQGGGMAGGEHEVLANENAAATPEGVVAGAFANPDFSNRAPREVPLDGASAWRAP